MQTLESVREKIRSNYSEVPSLRFRRLSDFCQVSECGEFYVGKVFVLGEARYEVWFKPKDVPSAVQLRMNLPSGAEAKSWASSIASAYRKGQISLAAPPSKAEIERLRATQ
jgi:hypothetical protein